jgi:molecular chaperone DnaJ
MENSSHNINVTAALTLEEIYTGVKKIFYIQRNVVCSQCQNYKKCPACKSTGLVLENVAQEIDIPAGVDTDMTLNFKNKGHQYPNKKNIWSKLLTKGNPRFGNLAVSIEQKPHPIFKRNGSDLIYICQISHQAIEQGPLPITIPHLSTEAMKIQIPQKTANGKLLRIKGKGFVDIENQTIGNLMIKIEYAL